MSDIDIAEVREWARAGGKIALRYFNNVTRQRKADRSWVTQADLEIEQFLRQQIAGRYPHHGIVGEEQGASATEREFVWAIDPVDGTGAFVAGLATWCISIGLLRRGEPYLGVISIPILDDCYWADATGPAYRNDSPIHVTEATEFDNNDWIGISSNAHRSYQISFPGKTRSLSSVAADFCYVARGSAVGALVGRANLWDIAGGLAILRAAGGVVVGISGRPLTTLPLLEEHKLDEALVLSSPALVERIRGYIRRAERG